MCLPIVGNRPLSRLRRALAPTGTLVLNGGGAPGHVFGPVAGILRVAVVNGLVRERLRLLPHEQEREQLLTLTGLIEAGKLTPVLDRTYPLADTAEGLRRVEQGARTRQGRHHRGVGGRGRAGTSGVGLGQVGRAVGLFTVTNIDDLV